MIRLFTGQIDLESRMAGLICAVFSIFVSVAPLVICVFSFIAVDFVTGCWASYVRAKRNNKRWYFESSKMWDTINKAILSACGIFMMLILEEYVLGIDTSLNLTKIFAGFICGVEMWSYLENASEISNHPVFIWLRKFVKDKIEDTTNIKIDE